jgi:hypothetical protein
MQISTRRRDKVSMAVVAAMDRDAQTGLSDVLAGLDQYFSTHAAFASMTAHDRGTANE